MGVRNRSLNTALSAFKISAKATDKVLGITYRNEIAVGTELVFMDLSQQVVHVSLVHSKYTPQHLSSART